MKEYAHVGHPAMLWTDCPPFAGARLAAVAARALGDRQPVGIWESSARRSTVGNFVEHVRARFTVIVSAPHRIYNCSAAEFGGNGIEPFTEINRRYTAIESSPSASDLSQFSGVELPEFFGGVFGFVAYDTARRFEKLPLGQSETEPDIFLLETDIVIIVDNDLGRLILVSRPNHSAEEVGQSMERMRALQVILQPFVANFPHATAAMGASQETFAVTERFERSAFTQLVEAAKEYIAAGDAFQVVLANTYTFTAHVDPFQLFDQLALSNPSPFHFLLRFGHQTLVGASPETMLKAEKPPSMASAVRTDHNTTADTVVTMRLVAGTYPRQDAESPERLSNDLKERAEHLMLVDHARNDIGRVSEIGSVQVKDLFSIESYRAVHHIVSQVTGTLHEQCTVLDALKACFPIATLTGTPKIRAMEIIAELEGSTRGVFGGAVVALGFDGKLDSTVIIRSVVLDASGGTIKAGAGIVFDSDPSREYDECRWKVSALLAAISSAVAGSNRVASASETDAADSPTLPVSHGTQERAES